MAQTDVGLRAKIAPDIDEQETRRQVSQLGDVIQEGLGRSIGNTLSKLLPTRLGSVLGQGLGAKIGGNVGSSSGGGATGAGGGGLGKLVALTNEQNEKLDTLIELLDNDFTSTGGGGGDGGGGGGLLGGVTNVLKGGGAAVAGSAATGAGVGLGALGLGATALGAGGVAAAGTGGLYMGLRQLIGPDAVDKKNQQVEDAERSSTGLGPEWTATSPTGTVGLAFALQEKIEDSDIDKTLEEATEGIAEFGKGLKNFFTDREHRAPGGAITGGEGERGRGNNWEFDRERGRGNDWSLSGGKGERGRGNDWTLNGSTLSRGQGNDWTLNGANLSRGQGNDWSLGKSPPSREMRKDQQASRKMQNNVTVNQRFDVDMSNLERQIREETDRSARQAMEKLQRQVNFLKS